MRGENMGGQISNAAVDYYLHAVQRVVAAFYKKQLPAETYQEFTYNLADWLDGEIGGVYQCELEDEWWYGVRFSDMVLDLEKNIFNGLYRKWYKETGQNFGYEPDISYEDWSYRFWGCGEEDLKRIEIEDVKKAVELEKAMYEHTLKHYNQLIDESKN